MLYVYFACQIFILKNAIYQKLIDIKENQLSVKPVKHYSNNEGLGLELSDREKFSSIQWEVLVQIFDFRICSIHSNISLSSK